jgi:hypothetical protein
MIHCQRCKQQNTPEAQKCSQCGTDLLPGYGAGERLGALIAGIVLGAICLALTFLIMKPDIALRTLSVGAVVLMLGFGLWWLFRRTPDYERYEIRAKRHVKLDPVQAIADYGAAIEHAPETAAFDLLDTRAKLCWSHGQPDLARSDWQRALENINSRITKSKDTDLELHKKRAETYQHLGKNDEYAMEMLAYTLAKEKTLKTQKREIARDIKGGIQKGSDDATRSELAKLREPILKDKRYALTGYCRKCDTTVDLDANLDCINNPKHWDISGVTPILRTGIEEEKAAQW